MLEIEPGAYVMPEHYLDRPWGPEQYVVLAGELTLTRGDVPDVLRQGDSLAVLREQLRASKNTGSDVCKLLLVLETNVEPRADAAAEEVEPRDA